MSPQVLPIRLQLLFFFQGIDLWRSFQGDLPPFFIAKKGGAKKSRPYTESLKTSLHSAICTPTRKRHLLIVLTNNQMAELKQGLNDAPFRLFSTLSA